MTDDLISRQAAIDLFPNDALEWDTNGGYVAPHLARRMIDELPSAQPEPEEFEWCHDCKEYDKERHCCHRWTKVIRKTVDVVSVRHAKLLNAHPYGECSNCGYLIDIREGFNYCPNCGARMDAE